MLNFSFYPFVGLLLVFGWNLDAARRNFGSVYCVETSSVIPGNQQCFDRYHGDWLDLHTRLENLLNFHCIAIAGCVPFLRSLPSNPTTASLTSTAAASADNVVRLPNAAAEETGQRYICYVFHQTFKDPFRTPIIFVCLALLS